MTKEDAKEVVFFGVRNQGLLTINHHPLIISYSGRLFLEGLGLGGIALDSHDIYEKQNRKKQETKTFPVATCDNFTRNFQH